MLQLRYCDLKVIKQNQPDEEERLMAILNQWLTMQWQSHQASTGCYSTKAFEKLTHKHVVHLHSITTQHLFVIVCNCSV